MTQQASLCALTFVVQYQAHPITHPTQSAASMILVEVMYISLAENVETTGNSTFEINVCHLR